MSDSRWMRRAIELAAGGLGTTAPNPTVGAVLVRDGVVLGEGHTQPVGGPHAEVVALAAARDAGHDVAGATLYSTLEPCRHHGRTPPCTDAIVAAGVSRAVVGVVDPFPEMQGRGIEVLRDAGLDVLVGVEHEACADLVRGFVRVNQGGLPEVTAKVAITLDGRIADYQGKSKWITGEAARAHGHLQRARHDAILVGIGTALADDPRLTCRTGGTDPVPVVLDSRLRLPASAKLLSSSKPALVYAAHDAPSRDPGAEVVRVDAGEGGLDVRAVLQDLGARGLHRVLVEGGAQVHRSLLDADVVDTLLVYVAGTWLPGGRPWVAGAAANLAGARRMVPREPQVLGSDVLLTYVRPTR